MKNRSQHLLVVEARTPQAFTCLIASCEKGKDYKLPTLFSVKRHMRLGRYRSHIQLNSLRLPLSAVTSSFFIFILFILFGVLIFFHLYFNLYLLVQRVNKKHKSALNRFMYHPRANNT
jgi:hypothetical protein